MLLSGRGEKFDVLTDPLGIGRTTTFEKVNGRRRWYADEVQSLAEFFGVPVARFYAGIGGVFSELSDQGNFHTDENQLPFFTMAPLPIAS